MEKYYKPTMVGKRNYMKWVMKPAFMPSHHFSCVMKKPVFGVSDQVKHEPGCTTTKDGNRLEISDI